MLHHMFIICLSYVYHTVCHTVYHTVYHMFIIWFIIVYLVYLSSCWFRFDCRAIAYCSCGGTEHEKSDNMFEPRKNCVLAPGLVCGFCGFCVCGFCSWFVVPAKQKPINTIGDVSQHLNCFHPEAACIICIFHCTNLRFSQPSC